MRLKASTGERSWGPLIILASYRDLRQASLGEGGGFRVTLLMGYASPEFAILASDQMITWRREERVNDEVQVRNKYNEPTIKATFFHGRYLIGFSGVADLGGNTEQWLLDHLAALASPSAFGMWRERLTTDIVAELKNLDRDAAHSWISLMAVGFAGDPAGTGEIVPNLETISNDIDPLRLHEGRASQEFLSFRRAGSTVDMAHQKFRLWAVGLVPPAAEMLQASDAIRHYRRRYPERSREIARTLARVIVRRSDALDGAGVGAAVQVTVMPRAAFGQERISMGVFTEPLDGVSSIEFNPSRRTNDGQPVVTGLNIVANGMIFMAPALAFGTTEAIGPREPFIEPED